MDIRGYGPVKEAAAKAVRQQVTEIKETLSPVA